ncbi:MAG: methyltransferase domain-containing protein, partial [Patescibacteria group bacterium]
MSAPEVVKYYEETVWDYFLFWINTKTLAMHHGYWDKNVTSHDASLLRLNEVIADKLKLKNSDYVLDAGCGLGGSALWVAQHRGCKVLGISITPDQIHRANEYAKKKHLEHLVTFRVADYTKLDIPTGTIDAVLAIETICHLKDP